jgi:hypothetical protein
MKKTSKELDEVQRQVVVRRHLLESGAIRIARTGSKSSSGHSEQKATAKQERELAQR